MSSARRGRRNFLTSIDAVTTNKTDFFREPRHYDVLVHQVLPCLVDPRSGRRRRKLKVWSAACSTGEEPYTLAMVLSEFGEKCPGFPFLHPGDRHLYQGSRKGHYGNL